jgi:hypothetical protein
MENEVPFLAVVEPQEEVAYAEVVGRDRLLVLPERDRGLIYARNWIRDHAEADGHAGHWQLDDNIIEFRRLWRGRRIPCHAGVSLRVCEDLTDRYENVAISGLNYQMFVPAETQVPFYTNVLVPCPDCGGMSAEEMYLSNDGERARRAEKYTSAELAVTMKQGHAIPNKSGAPSFPIGDLQDLSRAIRGVGRSSLADAGPLRRYIARRARELGHREMIPASWAADGSLKPSGRRWTKAEEADLRLRARAATATRYKGNRQRSQRAATSRSCRGVRPP